MNEYDEVDLRDYIEVLLRRKWIVILVTLSATIGAAVISFFVLKPVYQAKTVLLIPKFAPAVISKSMTIEEYINLQVIDILDLRKASGEKLSPDELEKMMVAEPVKGADLIEIKVESNDPKMAKEIANTWTNQAFKTPYIQKAPSRLNLKSLKGNWMRLRRKRRSLRRRVKFPYWKKRSVIK